MIVKKIFSPLKIVSYIRYELLFSILWTVLVWLSFEVFEFQKITLPFSIAATLGGALAIFLGFRNNSSYGRWWEARKSWAGIINSSRVLARLIITFTDSHSHQENYDKTRSENFKKSLIYKQIAWTKALKIQLREQNNWEEITPFLEKEDFDALMKTQNKVTFLQKIMGKQIYEAMANGTLGGFDSFQMEGQLLALANYQGACENIKTTPLLRQYHFFTMLFLYTFMFLFPICLVGDFHNLGISYMLIPTAVLINFVFSCIAKVGQVNEDPFENRVTDLPLNSLCNTIERDLKELLDETNLPQKIEVQNGYLS